MKKLVLGLQNQLAVITKRSAAGGSMRWCRLFLLVCVALGSSSLYSADPPAPTAPKGGADHGATSTSGPRQIAPASELSPAELTKLEQFSGLPAEFLELNYSKQMAAAVTQSFDKDTNVTELSKLAAGFQRPLNINQLREIRTGNANWLGAQAESARELKEGERRSDRLIRLMDALYLMSLARERKPLDPNDELWKRDPNFVEKFWPLAQKDAEDADKLNRQLADAADKAANTTGVTQQEAKKFLESQKISQLAWSGFIKKQIATGNAAEKTTLANFLQARAKDTPNPAYSQLDFLSKDGNDSVQVYIKKGSAEETLATLQQASRYTDGKYLVKEPLKNPKQRVYLSPKGLVNGAPFQIAESQAGSGQSSGESLQKVSDALNSASCANCHGALQVSGGPAYADIKITGKFRGQVKAVSLGQALDAIETVSAMQDVVSPQVKNQLKQWLNRAPSI